MNSAPLSVIALTADFFLRRIIMNASIADTAINATETVTNAAIIPGEMSVVIFGAFVEFVAFVAFVGDGDVVLFEEAV